MLVIERVGDELIYWCFEEWLIGFPDAERHEITVKGHANIDECPQEYIDAIRDFITRVRAKRAALAAV